MSGQLQASTSLPSGKELPVPIGQNDQWTAELFLTSWSKEASLVHAGSRTPILLWCILQLMSIPTEEDVSSYLPFNLLIVKKRFPEPS